MSPDDTVEVDASTPQSASVPTSQEETADVESSLEPEQSPLVDTSQVLEPVLTDSTPSDKASEGESSGDDDPEHVVVEFSDSPPQVAPVEKA